MPQQATREATDEEVIAWAAERWLKANADGYPGHDPGAEHIQLDDMYLETEQLFNEAADAVTEHSGTRHLIQQVFLWVYTSTDGDIAGEFLTVDLSPGIRVASGPLGALLPDTACLDGMNIRDLYRELITTITGTARSVITGYQDAITAAAQQQDQPRAV
jgi:hypothetical protein